MSRSVKKALGYFCLIFALVELFAIIAYQFINPELTQAQVFLQTWPIDLFITVQLWAYFKLAYE